jgi:formate C-acetyltransferase
MSRKVELNITRNEMSPLVKKLKNKLFNETDPQIDVRKLIIETEIYQKHGMSWGGNMLKAMVFDRLSHEKKFWVDENPICGFLTDYEYGSYFQPFREFEWAVDRREFAMQRGTIIATDEQMEVISKCAPFWIGNATKDRVRPIIKDRYGLDVQDLINVGIGLNFDDDMGTTTFPCHDTWINEGLEAQIEKIHNYKKHLKIWNVDRPDPTAGSLEMYKHGWDAPAYSCNPMPDYKKWEFYEACEISCKAAIYQANQYAKAAAEAAATCTDPEQKARWERSAEALMWVPAKPARTFYEAIQSQWIQTMCGWQNLCMTVDHAPARTPQYLYRCYRADKDAGKITDDEVIELFQCWFLKINTQNFVMSPELALWNSSRIAQQLTLGGLIPETGEDATNELDFLILEAQIQAQCPEPLLAVMYHNKLSKKFLYKCAELVHTGIGQPSFHGQECAMKRRMFHEEGPIEDIRNQAVSGCVQSMIPGKTDGAWEARFNMYKPLELCLNMGKNMKDDKEIGPCYGDPRDCKTWDEFYALLYKYYEYWIIICRDISTLEWNVMRDYPCPIVDVVTYDCLARGMSAVDGGARYNWGDGVCIAGNVDTTNCLAAIKKIVFDDKAATMDELIEALLCNWVGYEDLQAKCKAAPKYGNNDPYVDDLGAKLHADFAEIHNRRPDYMGRPTITPSAYSVTGHFPFGARSWASPDGRKAGACFTDATLSATPGTDVSGPTAVIHSAVKLIDPVVYGSTHFNMKFHPTALEGKENIEKFLALLKTYFDEGGYQIQFNCVTQEKLLAAKADPVAYKDLIVRVAGFSAYFVTLADAVQDEIISRTNQHW